MRSDAVLYPIVTNACYSKIGNGGLAQIERTGRGKRLAVFVGTSLVTNDE